MQFGPLVRCAGCGRTRGRVWEPTIYPVLSFLGGNFEQYQFHIRVEACPDAVCCVGEDCRIVNILECAELGGFLPGAAEQGTSAVTVCGNTVFDRLVLHGSG